VESRARIRSLISTNIDKAFPRPMRLANGARKLNTACRGWQLIPQSGARNQRGLRLKNAQSPWCGYFEQANGRIVAACRIYIPSLLFDLPPTLGIADAAGGQPVHPDRENEDRGSVQLVGPWIHARKHFPTMSDASLTPNVAAHRKRQAAATNNAQAEIAAFPGSKT